MVLTQLEDRDKAKLGLVCGAVLQDASWTSYRQLVKWALSVQDMQHRMAACISQLEELLPKSNGRIKQCAGGWGHVDIRRSRNRLLGDREYQTKIFELRLFIHDLLLELSAEERSCRASMLDLLTFNPCLQKAFELYKSSKSLLFVF